MSFTVFRKYQKPLLWVAVVFTVILFALFPIFGSVEDLFAGGSTEDLAGTFKVLPAGEVRRVGAREFEATRRNLTRMYALMGAQDVRVETDDVWVHLMSVADARAAGLMIPDQELNQFLTGGTGMTRERYQQLVSGLQFASTRDFERCVREFLLAQRWQEIRFLSKSVLPADEVYARWSVDNELFDFEALVFADLAEDEIPDPGDEPLREMWDEMPELLRERFFVDPAKVDVVFAWLPLDDPLASLSEEEAAEVDPSESDVNRRFQRLLTQRFPDAEDLDDETREMLRAELRVINHVQAGHNAFVEGETQDKDTFVAAMEARGLTVVDPDGLMEAEALTELDPIGTEILGQQLSYRSAGDTHFQPPMGDETHAYVVFIEANEEARPLAFDEARDQVLERWREQEASRPAQDFREMLREQTRELAEVQEVVAPLEEAAREAAAERIAELEAELAALQAEPTEDVEDAEEGDGEADTTTADRLAVVTELLSDEGRERILQEELDAIEGDIAARVAEFEVQLWDELAESSGAERITFEDVSRSYRAKPDEEDDPEGLDRYLKMNFQIFRLGVDGITDVIRHEASHQTAVVRVLDTRFPEMSAMFADEEGLVAARERQARETLSPLRDELGPAQMMIDHELAIPVAPEPGQDGEDGQGA